MAATMGSSYAFFGLDHAPFTHRGGTVHGLCWTAAARAAAAWLHEALANGEQLCWIIGPSGIGKTALLQLLAADDYGQRPWRIVTPEHYTAEALIVALQALISPRAQQEIALAEAYSAGPVLMVDHIERYPEAALHACLNWQRQAGQQAVDPPRLLLVGVEARGLDLRMVPESPADVPAAVYTLAPVTSADSAALLDHRLLLAGQAGPGLLPPASLELAHNLSRGIPGNLLDLCDLALYLSALHGCRQITQKCLQEAATYQGLLSGAGGPSPLNPSVAAVIRPLGEMPRPTANQPRSVWTWMLVLSLIVAALGTWYAILQTWPASLSLNNSEQSASTPFARTESATTSKAVPTAAQAPSEVPAPATDAALDKLQPLPASPKFPSKERAGSDDVAVLLNQASSGMGQYFVSEEALLRRISQLPSPTVVLPRREAEGLAKDENGFPEQAAGKGPTRPTNLVQAALEGNYQVVRELLGQGVPVNSADGQEETALMKAAWFGSIEVVELLLNKGAEVNRQSKIGNTALLFAAIKGHGPVVELLLSRGAAVNQADRNGRTPLMAAAWNGHREVVALLLAQHANPNLTTRDGWTPMMYAALANRREIGLLLLHGGANPGLKNREGFDCLQVANQQGHSEFATLLGQARW